MRRLPNADGIRLLVGLLGLAPVLPAAALAAPPGDPAAVREVYVSTGDYGEVSFSDLAQPGAERLELAVTPVPEDALAESERRIEQTLDVAGALEASRLAREQARAQARADAAAAQARAQPQVIYRDTYDDYPYVYYPGRWPGRWPDHRPGHRPGRPEHLPARPRPQRTLSSPFPYSAD